MLLRMGIPGALRDTSTSYPVLSTAPWSIGGLARVLEARETLTNETLVPP